MTSSLAHVTTGYLLLVHDGSGVHLIEGGVLINDVHDGEGPEEEEVF